MSDLSKKAERIAKREKRKAERKPFKETKIGEFLTDKAPKLLDVVGDFLPDQGGLGVIKNIISKDDNISKEDKAEALRLIDLELKELDLYLADQQNARQREVELVKSGKDKDLLMLSVGYSGIVIFLLGVWYGLFSNEPNEKMYFHILGISEGVALTLFSYYFGNNIRLK